MRDRQPEVFIEMENFHAGPVDPRCSGQSIQEFELRRSRRSDDPRTAKLSNGASNRCRCLVGGRLSCHDSIIEYFEQHEECSGGIVQDFRLLNRQIIQNSGAKKRDGSRV
jgi:hypothetical protein